MKKSIIKKLFIKLSKIMGYEIIDQNSFTSPTLDRDLNKDLSKINEKSIVLPLGEVKISRKVKSILILFRTNSNVEIWDQNNFVSPTLNRELNDNLSILNDKSIILPLGEVKISRKISSVLILFRTNSLSLIHI